MTTEIEELFNETLSGLVKGEPISFIRYMLVKIGEMCVEANAETMNLNQECTLNHIRYDIDCKITVKKLKVNKRRKVSLPKHK